jgi:hypothetical protein
MAKKNTKLYDDPAAMEESELGRTTISSHMSFLTNKRIHDLFQINDVNSYTASRTLQPSALNDYGSSLWAIFMNIECVLPDSIDIGDKEKKKIIPGALLKKLFEKYNTQRFKKTTDPKKRYETYEILSYIHRIIMYSLQRPYQFFFRKESMPIKGIRRTLEMKGWLDDEELQGVSKD